MLTATIQGPSGFGRLGAEEDDLPRYVGILQQLKSVEDNLYEIYTTISTLVTVMGDQTLVPTDLLIEYNNNVYQLDLAAKDWIDAQKAAGNPSTDVTLPPRFLDASGNVLSGSGWGLSGWGAATVPASQINVAFGPKSRPQIVPLGDSRAVLVGHQRQRQGMFGGGNGLAGPETLIIYFIGVAMLLGGIILIIRNWQMSAVASTEARALESRSVTERLKLMLAAQAKMYTDCASGAGTAEQRQKCASATSAALANVIKNLPKTPGGPGDWGFLKTIGLVVVLGGAAYGGWRLYQHKKSAPSAA